MCNCSVDVVPVTFVQCTVATCIYLKPYPLSKIHCNLMLWLLKEVGFNYGPSHFGTGVGFQ